MPTEKGKTELFISKMVKRDGDLKDKCIYERHLTSGGGTYLPLTGGTMAGVIDMNQYQFYQMVIENRTSDPTSPVTGQIWIRTDL